MRTKRKRAAVVWLPQDLDNRLGEAPVAATTPEQSAIIIKIYTLPALGVTPTTEDIPVVKDFAILQNEIGGSLADIEDSGYRLRRVVGKLFFGVQQGNATAANDPTSWIVTAGLIVRRTNGADPYLGLTSIFNSTQSLGNTADPWIWRRSWVLQDNQSVPPASPPGTTFPSANSQYGSALDGAHIDAKTARVVGPEERLFLTVTCAGLDGQAQGNPGALLMVGDLRILGSMRTSVGNRRNASR